MKKVAQDKTTATTGRRRRPKAKPGKLISFPADRGTQRAAPSDFAAGLKAAIAAALGACSKDNIDAIREDLQSAQADELAMLVNSSGATAAPEGTLVYSNPILALRDLAGFAPAVSKAIEHLDFCERNREQEGQEGRPAECAKVIDLATARCHRSRSANALVGSQRSSGRT